MENTSRALNRAFKSWTKRCMCGKAVFRPGGHGRINAQSDQNRFPFHPLGRREAAGSSDGGHINSDGGGLLLRETERSVRVIEQFAGCFTDYRTTNWRRVQAEIVLCDGRGLRSG